MQKHNSSDLSETEVELHNLRVAHAGISRRYLLTASARASLLVAGAAGSLAIPSPAAAGPGELFLNPFNKLSAHHRPVGMGIAGRNAVTNPDVYYGIPGTTGPATRGRMATVTSINLQGPVGIKFMHRVSSADPFRPIGRASNSLPGSGLPFTCRMPTGAVYPPELPEPKDCNVYLYPRDGLHQDMGDLFMQFRYRDARAQHHRAYGLGGLDHGGATDGGDRGTSASKLRWPSSMLRYHELAGSNPAPISHCLNVLATRKSAPAGAHILAKRRVWPAYGMDSSASQPGENLGDIPYGTRFVIRWQDRGLRDSSALNLTARGRVLFDCLLYYGFYVVDGANHAGANGGGLIGFRHDQAPTATGEWPKPLKDEVLGALRKLVPLCWPVRYVRSDSFESEIYNNGLPYASGGGPIGPGAVNSAWDA